MVDTKISALAAAATPLDGTEVIPIVQSATTKKVTVATLFSWDNNAWSGWILPVDASWVGTAGQPLTSTSWDGDAHSTTAKTSIDLSAVFAVPAGIRAALIRLTARDSGSAAGSNIFFMVGNNNDANVGPLWVWLDGVTNDKYRDAYGMVPCDANGDIYYQIGASGASTLDAHIQIFGYLL